MDMPVIDTSGTDPVESRQYEPDQDEIMVTRHTARPLDAFLVGLCGGFGVVIALLMGYFVIATHLRATLRAAITQPVQSAEEHQSTP